MTASLTICGLSCICMILSILFFPRVRIGRWGVDTYWLIVSAGAAIMIINGQIDISAVISSLLADTAINPLKILVLFVSMTILSIFLDELGFFAYLANKALTLAGKSQFRLFLILYITVSVLTVFTSNDIIILTFTPFICYFAKNAEISPIPYLVAQFVAANTWSMMLVIGNPTNIYLATAYDVDFVSYLRIMAFPTFAAGTVAFVVLWLIFRKKLSLPLVPHVAVIKIKDKLLLTVGIIHLSVCTVTLAVGSYIGAQMWVISLLSAVSLFVFTSVISAFRHRYPSQLVSCLRRAPWQLVPFVVSMFILILALAEHGVTQWISNALGNGATVWKYGIVSMLSANVINNIPMSVLFCSVIEFTSATCRTGAVYAAVVGSNLGALVTPIGALAGIIWTMILKNHGVKFGYWDFIKYGVAVSVPAAAAAFGALYIVL
ncbi:MAG: hypothetical protein E7588_04695 [Ruminococcaceae bacterium]|nr:hypothetical protein [Oscillospiraceae bacterium]